MTLILYDHLITIDIEVERIWTLKCGLPKVLFMTSRYVVPPLLMITSIGTSGYPLLFSFCKFETHLALPVRALSLFTGQLVLLIRVSALYGHSKIWLSFLLCFFTFQFAAVIVGVVVNVKMETAVLSYQFIPGCWAHSESNLGRNYLWWIPFICFDGVLLILTLGKAFSYRDNFNPTIKLLAQDSIVYFAIISGCVLLTIVTWPHPSISVNIPAEWVVCIAVSRMMMNIRGLTFNNPLVSQGINFSAIIFRNRSGLENSRGAGTEQHASRV